MKESAVDNLDAGQYIIFLFNLEKDSSRKDEAYGERSVGINGRCEWLSKFKMNSRTNHAAVDQQAVFDDDPPKSTLRWTENFDVEPLINCKTIGNLGRIKMRKLGLR